MTRYELCTVVDVGYLPRAIVLYRSLVEQGVRFRLCILCLDEETESLVGRLRLPEVRTLTLRELETWDGELSEVRPTRTLAEYCWTLKPSLLLHLLQLEPELDLLAYIDADHMFWGTPEPVLDELGDGSVLVVPQRTASDRAGRYNAGFVLFRRSRDANVILSWWRERCLEWSHVGVGGGNRRFGDQGYLEDWPARFSGVRVLRHPGGGLAPWNTDRHELAVRDGEVMVDGLPLFLFHHQSLRLYRGLRRLHRLRLLSDRFHYQPDPIPLVWSIGRWYAFGERERMLIWEPYVRRISQAIHDLRAMEGTFEPTLLELSRLDVANEVVRSVTPRPARRALRRARDAVVRTRPAHG